MHEKSFRNALHRCHGLFFLHHIKTQVVKERLIGFFAEVQLILCKDNNLFLSCSRFDKKNIESLHRALKPCNPFLTHLSTILSFLVNAFKLLRNAVLTMGA